MKLSLRKILLDILLFLLLVFIAFTAYYCIKGYSMYRYAVEQIPISRIMDDIRSREHFVSYYELPEIYINAVISAEDQRFDSHHGIDIPAIGRAIWIDIKTMSFAEGGSTISQQLVKNELFTQRKHIERKFAEVFAALALEREYSKEEIFEMYVNSIYFGSGFYGIYDASEGFFGKPPCELSDCEAVMLAGLPNAPSVYSPDVSPELAMQRMSVVLDRMVQYGVLTEQESDRIEADAGNMTIIHHAIPAAG